MRNDRIKIEKTRIKIEKKEEKKWI